MVLHIEAGNLVAILSYMSERHLSPEFEALIAVQAAIRPIVQVTPFEVLYFAVQARSTIEEERVLAGELARER
jgi:hypothetical protein